jgi:hypothetical protein
MAIVDSRERRGSLKIADATGALVDHSCQPTAVRIVPATETGGGEQLEVLCGDTASDAVGGARTVNMEITAISDFEDPDGLVAHSWVDDGQTRQFEFNPTGNAQDLWEGTVVLQAIPVGGTVGERLTETATWVVPSVKLPPRFGYTDNGGWWLGTAPTPPAPAPAPTGADAGTPGTFTPAGAQVPADLAALTGANPAIVANPATAWTTGQHVVLGTGTAYWDGTQYVAGMAP